MNIKYDPTNDLLYIRIDEKKQDVTNQRVTDEIVLDIGEDEKIVGIEILDASKKLDLEKVQPVKYELERMGRTRMIDPIVEEMRNAGRKIQEECGNDWDRFFERIRENEKKLKAEGWKFVDLKPQHKKASSRAINVKVTKEELTVFLEDGRVVSTSLEWFPRLRNASEAELSQWEFIGGGIGIHWESIDEDISVKGLLEAE